MGVVTSLLGTYIKSTYAFDFLATVKFQSGLVVWVWMCVFEGSNDNWEIKVGQECFVSLGLLW